MALQCDLTFITVAGSARLAYHRAVLAARLWLQAAPLPARQEPVHHLGHPPDDTPRTIAAFLAGPRTDSDISTPTRPGHVLPFSTRPYAAG